MMNRIRAGELLDRATTVGIGRILKPSSMKRAHQRLQRHARPRALGARPARPEDLRSMGIRVAGVKRRG